MKILSESDLVRLNSTANRKLLEALSEDMLSQTWENYPEYDEEDAYECTLDHVIFVITELDDEEEPIYQRLLPYADYNNKTFCNIVKNYVHDHYDDYYQYSGI